jgi:hypothetical protein
MKSAIQRISKANQLLAIVGAMVLIGCAPNDPIDSLAQRLSSDRYWHNGYVYPINLPASASPNKLIIEAFDHTAASDVKPATMHISNQRKVKIKGFEYLALLVETDVGEKIVLLQYVEKAHCWFSYVFNVKAVGEFSFSVRDCAV